MKTYKLLMPLILFYVVTVSSCDKSELGKQNIHPTPVMVMPSSAKVNEVITVDMSGSYDTDGTIREYAFGIDTKWAITTEWQESALYTLSFDVIGVHTVRGYVEDNIGWSESIQKEILIIE